MKRFRSNAGWVAGWAWLVFAGVNFVDLAARGRSREAVVAGLVILVGCGLAYVLGLRPRVVGDADGMSVVNPLRTVRVPWGAVGEIEGGRVLAVSYDGGRVEAWAVQVSGRRWRKKPEKPVDGTPKSIAEQVKDRTVVDFAVDELTALWRRGAGKGGDARVAWAWDAVAALAVPVVALVAAILV